MCYVPKLPAIAGSFFPSPPISAGKACWSVLRFHSISVPSSSFETSTMKDIYAVDSNTFKKLKDVIVSKLGDQYSQIVDEDLAYPVIIRLPAVTLRKRVQKE